MKLAYLLLAGVAAVTVLAFYGLAGFAGGEVAWELLGDTYLQGILWFSIKQALFSAIGSVLLALPIARALYYQPLFAKQAFLTLCLLGFVLPTLVLVTGLVAALGRSGWLVSWLGEHWNLYGLQGILLAHIYLNMPFAIRALYLQLQAIPETSWRLARQLKMSPWQRWKMVEWPVLRGRLGVLGGFIFVLCFNSFAVVLALGGGPQSTTLEVAIYQALKYDFNIPEALVLAWLQFVIAGGLFLLLSRFGSLSWLSADTGRQRWLGLPSRYFSLLNYMIYSIAWLFLLLPLLALFPGLLVLDINQLNWMVFIKPSLVSLGLGLFCALAALFMAYIILLPIRAARYQKKIRRQWLLEWLSIHTLVAPAMVLSVGLYIFLLTRIDLDHWGMAVVAGLNTLMVLPFALQQLRPRLFQFDDQYRPLVRMLKLNPWQRLRIELPWLRTASQAAFVLVFLLAMGDVAIFSIFGQRDWMTLPWLIYSYASTYRMAEASLASFVLLLIFAVVVAWFERSRQHVKD
ncbi:MAG: thiamine/thiamine pyrophosphate ABC transporter permease ThiP [Proteobacteria bacterium]|nr:MAG: thiamine/thiamine pyrophosphate ABC transporter permease ThiP [Pseudomonadota bacterium]